MCLEEKDHKKSPYDKYEDLYWYFKDEERDKTKVEEGNKKIQIENGVAYFYTGNSKKIIDSIGEKVKFITSWGEHKLSIVYLLTEEGTIWKSECDDTWGLNSNFVKVNMNEKVIDMTDGLYYRRIIEPPYFLLANGELVNKEGSKYEELEGDFVKCIGELLDRIFIKEDNTMYRYNSETRKYTQIKDENNNSIKMKDAFVQWENDRIFVITQDDKLFYIEGYFSVVAKEYKETAGKTVKDIVEEKDDNITNVRITFKDGTEEVIKDAYMSCINE